ncbi:MULTISPECIES: ribosomal protection-like ABC-F family protein [Bacillus]|uniref:ABC-F type ribosomal protection protein n=4 Tax=Bacillus cereus group TaxID=86661 RepID=A0AAP4Q7S6_BACTU|nr:MULTISPECIES: ABC-F type ribosomal protection protein [Bacillus]MEC2875339.1 ABC-F type ribosomal protection protein [Bacillus cereus]EEM30935.1 ABC transporter ATP-binding protein uup [Bacillus thuringiensis Bt407]EEM37259.1 ABC transporter ATP-binding protein uup [Bacillus thuringiensis serovar thuringiensis str. T01001]EEM68159.1 ABC transporter ATP-binding protein uup [Bacillus thuringiensis serovar berliner ATCC 10792]MBN6708775.1 ABC-F type ribosomal protection protein [Bacillus thuri
MGNVSFSWFFILKGVRKMTICSVNNVTKSFGGNTIFENISLEIKNGERVGLVGRNGSGKTTIFGLLTGMESLDAGAIHMKKGTRIGHVAQIPKFDEAMTVYDVLSSAFKVEKELEKEMHALEKNMAVEQEQSALEKLMERYGVIQEKFAFLGGYEIEANIMKVANGLQVTDLFSRVFTELSGGEQTKVSLAYMLLQKPDLLLLDEPTNHLDLFAVEWLEQFLKEYTGTVMVISHDRYFLDEVVTKIFDLEDGEIHVYHTNYSQFVEEKGERLLQEFQAYQEQQKKIKKMKEAIKRLREWANQANPPNEGLHKRARNMERALERIEKLKRPILERKQMGLQFEGQERSGKDVVVMKEVSKGFAGRPLFEQANLHVRFQERAAIVGRNGTGKTTLLKLLLKEINPDVGEIRIGSSVKIGYLSQHTYGNVKSNVLEAFREYVAVTEGEARHILAKFLFYGPAVFKKVTQLSGGEKMRLRLAQLMYQDINFLILDEPTNHLDIESREVLEEALEQYNGTILAVSHDRYFLNKLFEKTYWIDECKLFEFAGNYAWARQKWEEKLEKQVIKQKRQGRKSVEMVPVKEKKARNLEEIENELMHVEEDIYAIECEMEHVADVERLEKLYEEKTMKELLRAKLYSELENIVE